MDLVQTEARRVCIYQCSVLQQMYYVLISFLRQVVCRILPVDRQFYYAINLWSLWT